MKARDQFYSEYDNNIPTSTFSVTCYSQEEAQQLFLNARNNLLNISDWQRLAGKTSAAFILTDSERQPVTRQAMNGDEIRIEYQHSDRAVSAIWVRVVAVEEDHHDLSRSQVILRLKLVDTFASEHDLIDDHKTSSTFMVEKRNSVITASVFGSTAERERESEGLLSTLRRSLMPVNAVTGLSTPQWQNLVIGMLKVPYQGALPDLQMPLTQPSPD